MARDWHAALDDLRPVRKLVHLAMRLTPFDADRIRGELTKARRRAYESELTIQAARAGCRSRHGRLTTGPALTELNEMSKRDAGSIVNTYNYDLVIAIEAIAAAAPTANRHVYAKRLSAWEAKRGQWKAAQIGQLTDGSARSMAQRDFRQFNDIQGSAVLRPKTAVCPVCQGWVNRGLVLLEVAMNNPPPYHVNCPHLWVTKPNKLPAHACADLWMGD